MREVPEFVLHCIDLLRGAGAIEPRPMFGSWGIFIQDRMFALISDETLYLKADDRNRPAFEAERLEPFVYSSKGGKSVSLPYWQAPPDAMEDPLLMRSWAQGAVDAALRAPAPRRPATLSGALNLGPKSAVWLAEVEIHTPADLKRVGAARAFARIKRARPKQASLNLLYALHGAIAGLRWDRVDKSTKARLAEAAQSALNALERKQKARSIPRLPKR